MSKSDLSTLTPQGQQFYADARQDGVSHEQALADARHSYGVQRGAGTNLRRNRKNRVTRGGWVAPLSGDQFSGLASAVGPSSVMTGTDSGAGDGGGGDGGGSV